MPDSTAKLGELKSSNESSPIKFETIDTNDTMLNSNMTDPKYSMNNKAIEAEIARTLNLVWTFINCVFVIGQIIGGLCSKYALEYLGRKKSFLFSNIFTVIAAGLVIAAPYVKSPVCLMLSRFFFGVQSGSY